MGNGSDDWMKAGVMCTRGAIVALSSGAIVGAGLFVVVCLTVQVKHYCVSHSVVRVLEFCYRLWILDRVD